MAKITCVGQIWSFIHYHSGHQGLQKKAASMSCDRGGAGYREAVEEARSLTVNTDLSDSPRRKSKIYNHGSFQKVRPVPLLGVSWEPLFQLLMPYKADPYTPSTRAMCSADIRGKLRHWFLFSETTWILPQDTPNQLGKPCGRRFPQTCSSRRLA